MFLHISERARKKKKKLNNPSLFQFHKANIIQIEYLVFIDLGERETTKEVGTLNFKESKGMHMIEGAEENKGKKTRGGNDIILLQIKY